MFWNVNAVMSFGFARAGAVVRAFDPLLYDGAGALRDEAGLPFGEPAAALGAAFVLAERLTSIRIQREWLLNRRRPTYEIAAP